MISLLGFEIALPPELLFLATPAVNFALNLSAWILIAVVVNFVVLRIFRIITRQLPGELEDILLAILRRPLVALLIIVGTERSLELLPLTGTALDIIRRITYSLLILAVTHILGRMIQDVLVYYGEKWARRTESRVDDVVVPIINLFGPLLLILIASLLIFPLWGINVGSVLVGAGVVGLILGLALQETLSNVFSGLSLLVEAPFRTGDLITLPDGRNCEVLRIGLRSTQMYSIAEHSTVYVPNKSLTTVTLTNITKPTVEQKYSIDVLVDSSVDLIEVQECLRRIALAHPATLVSKMAMKIPLLEEGIAQARAKAGTFDAQAPVAIALKREANLNEVCLPRLEKEGELNALIDKLQESLRHLLRGIREREYKGISEAERQELYCNFVSPTDQLFQEAIALAECWSQLPDAWLDEHDHWDQRRLWEFRNEQMRQNWERLKKQIYNPDERLEMRLDDLTKAMIDWIKNEYKVSPAYWKDPSVTLKQFNGGKAQLQLWFYVDNIRLEHDGRAQRVYTEIGRQVNESLRAMQIWT